jgi:hypothetical protein
MPQHSINGRNIGHRGLRATRGAALATLVVCAGASFAQAGEDDDTMAASPSVYQKMLDVIGLGSPGSIQYSERSPLVVPPTRDLPPPAATAAPPVPNWPKDPDITRAKQAKVKEKNGPNPNWVIENSRPLRPDELSVPGSKPAPGGTPTPVTGPSPADYPDQIERSKKSVFNFDWLKKEQYATFTGEPARASLTDPPPGYLTPSPDQPYGIGPDKRQYKVPTVADRVTPTSGTAGGN